MIFPLPQAPPPPQNSLGVGLIVGSGKCESLGDSDGDGELIDGELIDGGPAVDGGSWRTQGADFGATGFQYPDFLLADTEITGVKGGKKAKL